MASPTPGLIVRGRSARRDDGYVRPIAGALNLDADHVDTINRSHDRCAALGLSRIERPDLGLLGRADLEIARSRNLRLHQHAAPVMELLYDQIVNTHSMVVLTDATGTIVHVDRRRRLSQPRLQDRRCSRAPCGRRRTRAPTRWARR